MNVKLRIPALVLASSLFAASLTPSALASSIPTVSEIMQLYTSTELIQMDSIAKELGYIGAYELLQNIISDTNAYDPSNIFDLTGDNQITLNDATVVLDFLHGNCQYAYNYYELDGDGDGKIDSDDVNAYLSYYNEIIAMLITDECITTHTSRNYTPESLTFRKYNAQTGAYKSSYILGVAPNNTANVFDENSYITQEIDETETVRSITDLGMPNEHVLYHGTYSTDKYPLGIVKIQTYFGSDFTSEGIGSGFVIDNHTIATAAHVVWNASSQYATNCKVKNKKLTLFNAKGTALSSLTITPVEYHVPVKYMQGYTDGYDFALITVSQNLQNYVSLTLGLPLAEFINSGSIVHNTGTPAVVGGQTENTDTKHTLYTTYGGIFDFNTSDPTNKIVGAYAPATASGAPLYYPSNKAVLGIVRVGAGQYGENCGSTTIKSEMFKFYYANPYIVY